VPLDKVRLWAMRPTSKVYRIVDIVNGAGSFSRHRLIREIERLRISRNAPGAVASLLTNAGNGLWSHLRRKGRAYLYPSRARGSGNAILATNRSIWPHLRSGGVGGSVSV
jgi:hypothetical protein